MARTPGKYEQLMAKRIAQHAAERKYACHDCGTREKVNNKGSDENWRCDTCRKPYEAKRAAELERMYGRPE